VALQYKEGKETKGENYQLNTCPSSIVYLRMEYKAWECGGDVPAQTRENRYQYKKMASKRL
jgi:hypothetical protein